MVKTQKSNQLILLENLRFHPGETENAPDFARSLVAGFDFYVDDAFGAVHRAHASVAAAAEQFPMSRRAAGLLVEKEVAALDRIIKDPDPPFTVVMGGAKVSDKINVILNLIDRCNHLLVGGAMAYTFLKFQGHRVGASKVEEDKMNMIEKIMKRAQERHVQIHLPMDHVEQRIFRLTQKLTLSIQLKSLLN